MSHGSPEPWPLPETFPPKPALCWLLQCRASRADAIRPFYVYFLLLFRAEMVSRGSKALSQPVSCPGLGAAGSSPPPSRSAASASIASPGSRRGSGCSPGPGSELGWPWVSPALGFFGHSLVKPREGSTQHTLSLLLGCSAPAPSNPKAQRAPPALPGWLSGPDCHPDRQMGCHPGGASAWGDVRPHNGLGRAGAVRGAGLGLSQGSLI